jgi:peptidoglycan-associated lipoprotein
MSYLRIARFGITSALLFSLCACAAFKKKPAYAGSDGDYVNGSPIGTPLSERQDGVSFLGDNVERGRFSPVHFGFDSYVVEPGETANLSEVASFMKSSSKQLVIAGFTDERGTPEYNRGLGERRALAVRSYLISRGVDASRIQTTSFGLEMPVDPGHNESAWAKNRRAEFGVTK